MTGQPMTTSSPKQRSRLAVAFRRTLMVVLAIAVAWLGWWWIRYPHVPNVKEAPMADCVAFMGGKDFNRMTHHDRVRFSLGVVDKLKDKSFSDLVAMSMQRDDARKAAAENVRQLDKSEQEQIGSAFMTLFLAKFYQQDAAKRAAYLFGMVMMQKAGGGDAAAKNHGLPSVDQFKKSLANFITNQPPQSQALLSQFMLDIGKEQRLLGAKPF
jgi:hypothetical protein